jgi:hypothetical protein
MMGGGLMGAIVDDADKREAQLLAYDAEDFDGAVVGGVDNDDEDDDIEEELESTVHGVDEDDGSGSATAPL